MVGAITLAEFYLHEAKRLSDAAEIKTETAEAEKLRQWLLNRWPAIAQGKDREPDTFLPGDVMQFGPNSLRVAVDVKKYLIILKNYGWIIQLAGGAEVGGKARKSAFRIVRPE